jgi:ubiquinone/menaquinone biosynthesis C-methylase UbiE
MPIEDYNRHLQEHDRYWKVMPTLYHQLGVAPSGAGFKERMDWIVANARGSTLDCGCNDGTFIHAVKVGGNKTIGIDIIPINIERAHILYPEDEFYIMDVEDLKFSEESFDTVVFTETIEHMVNPRKALREIHRVMHRNGRLLCTTTYIKDEPTHYQDFHDTSVFLNMLEEFFFIETVTTGIAGCVMVVAAWKEV